MKLPNSFAYYAFEFVPKDYYNRQTLLASSLSESLLVFGVNNKENTLIDESSIILLNEQSLAAHFWDYEKIVVFVGTKNVDLQQNEINISLGDASNNLYYYIPRFNYGFSSFHYECKDGTTTHYLISNFGNLDSNKKYNFKFHNLIPEKVSVANLPANTNNVQQLEYKDAKRFNYLDKTESHLHVLKVQCPGEGKKIILNWKYTDMSQNTGMTMAGIVTKDFYLDFSKNNSYSINYILDESTEISLEVFIPESENETKLEVEFEGKKWRLSPLTKEIQTRRGKVTKSGAYQGAQYWAYEGMRLADFIGG